MRQSKEWVLGVLSHSIPVSNAQASSIQFSSQVLEALHLSRDFCFDVRLSAFNFLLIPTFSQNWVYFAILFRREKRLIIFWLLISITSHISSYLTCSNNLSKFDSLTVWFSGTGNCDNPIYFCLECNCIHQKCMWVSMVFEFKVHLHVDPFSLAVCTFELKSQVFL